MIEVNVAGMTCGHCVEAVTAAVKSLDAEADVQVYLDEGRVRVSSRNSAAEIARAIEAAGYSAAPTGSAATDSGKGCCCRAGSCSR